MIRIAAAHAVTPGGVVGPVVIEVDNGVVTGIESPRRRSAPAPEITLVPGFVDLQVNGHGDVDVGTAAGSEWDRLDQILVRQGVTTWCPALTTRSMAEYERALREIASAAQRGGARPSIAGVHLEGPFISPDYARGHQREHIADVDLGWLAALPAQVRVVTLAPELPRALEAVDLLASRGVLVALGHSGAGEADTRAAADAGARLVTHLFNAMAPLHHRAPALAGTALVDPRLAVSLIADGVHISDQVVSLVLATKGAEGTVLVTDATAWQGRAGDRVALRAGAPRLTDGTLAGSALTMDRAVAKLVGLGIPLEDAVAAASTTPARLLGLHDRGRIEVGARADLVALARDLAVEAVWIGGEPARV